MATAPATGNHRATTEQRSQRMTEIQSKPRSKPRSQPRNGTPNGTPGEPGSTTVGLAQQARDQLVSTIQQGQQVSIEAAQTFVETLSTIPVLPLRKIPYVPRFLAFPMGGLEALTGFFFDVAADLLNAQREYTLALVRLFASEEPV